MTANTERGRARKLNWTAIGFVIAFLLSTATVIYTGLLVKAPGAHRPAGAGETPAESDIGPRAVPEQHAFYDSAAARLPKPEPADGAADKLEPSSAPTAPAEPAE